jgi:hypothetical protein
MRLRKLKLEFVRISSALFWPGGGEEDYDTTCLHWPKLEELVVLGVPPYTADGMLPSLSLAALRCAPFFSSVPVLTTLGKWILDNDAGRWHHISLEELEADPDQGWDYDTGHYGYRDIMRRDAADEMYSSMGRAARRMPRLRRLEFSFRAETGECGPTERLEFGRDLSMGKSRLQIATGCWYLIGEKVILAWGLQGKLAPQSVAPECRGRLTHKDERDGSVALVHRKKKTKKPSCHDGACSVEFEKWP